MNTHPANFAEPRPPSPARDHNRPLAENPGRVREREGVRAVRTSTFATDAKQSLRGFAPSPSC